MLRLEGREGSIQAMASGNPLERESSGEKNPRADLSLIREKPYEGHGAWIQCGSRMWTRGRRESAGSFCLFLLILY